MLARLLVAGPYSLEEQRRQRLRKHRPLIGETLAESGFDFGGLSGVERDHLFEGVPNILDQVIDREVFRPCSVAGMTYSWSFLLSFVVAGEPDPGQGPRHSLCFGCGRSEQAVTRRPHLIGP